MRKKNFGTISRITAAALLVSSFASPLGSLSAKAAATAATDSTVKLRFMETTDLHDNVMDYDYFKDAPTIDYGLDRTAQLIHQARADKVNPADPNSQTYDQNSMLFDAGDTLQGNPMADYEAKVKGLTENDVHPMFKAMGLLNYDAGIPGNHEFNYGLDYLNTALKHVPYNFVNANIYKDDHDNDPTNDQNYFTPYKIIDKVVKDENGVEQTIKVGVIGFAPPQIMEWDYDNLHGKVIAKDMVKTAQEFIPKMKAEGADIIVAIAHSGCDVAQADQQNAENAVYALTKVPGIDALLFGHAHVNFPGAPQFNGDNTIDNVNGHINNVPAMEAGFWGNNLGVMDLNLQRTDGKWTVTSSKAALRPLTTKDANGNKISTVTGPDQQIVDAVKDAHEGTLNYVRGKIGTTSAPLDSFFAQVQDDPTIQIVNNAQTDYVKKWIETKSPELKGIPVLSAGAPFKAGGRSGVSYYTNIPAGELSIKSANDLYLYPNTLKAVEVTGATVREWLEMAAGQFNTVDPSKADPQNIVNDSFPSYNFDVIDGVKYQIDITQQPRYDKNGVVINPDSHRIKNLTMPDGTPLKDYQQFIVVTNNYRAGGGGNFPGLKGGIGKIVINSPDESRQVLINYIAQHGTVNPSADNNWQFAPVGGVAKLVFNSSPDAKPFAAASQNIKDLGPNPDGSGFEQYSLDQKVHVQLLGINDFHGQLDYSTKVGGKPVGGIQYLAGYLKERKATNPNTLMVEAGDLIGASRPVSSLLQDEPTVRFMNELGFDVGTLGNHEFDEGLAELKRMINGGSNPKTQKYEAEYGKYTGANFPVVCANAIYEKTGKPLLNPYFIKEVGGVKIGFIGVVTTETPSIVIPSGVAGVKFTDEVEAINKYTAELKAKGIKAIVVLAHDPGKSATDGSNPTGRLVDVAKAVDPEVDVIFGAHDHAYMNSTVNGKLLVQSYSYGTAFSDVNLTIDPVTQDIIDKKAEIVSTFQDPQHLDTGIKAELDKYEADIAPITNQVIGKSATDITRTSSAAGESALGDLIADVMQNAAKSDFAFMNAGGIRNDLAKGTITWGTLFGIQPFGNDVVKLKLKGDQVRALLNQQWTPSTTKIMQVAGLTYTWNSKFPVGQKVMDIFLPNGHKLDAKKVYSVAVNNFMADGGDGFTVLKQGTNRVTISSDLDAFINYTKAQKRPIFSKLEGRISVTDTSAPKDNHRTTKSTKGKGKPALHAPKGNHGTTKSTKGKGKTALHAPKGNHGTTKSTKVKDKTAPHAPKMNSVTGKSTKVTGSGEVDASVYVKNGNKVIGKGVVDKHGHFYFAISKQKAGTVLTVIAVDRSFNVSKSTKVTVSK